MHFSKTKLNITGEGQIWPEQDCQAYAKNIYRALSLSFSVRIISLSLSHWLFLSLSIFLFLSLSLFQRYWTYSYRRDSVEYSSEVAQSGEHRVYIISSLPLLIKQIYRSFDYKKTFDLQTLKAAVALWIIVPQSRVWGHYMSPPPQIVLEIFLDGTSDHVGHTWRKKSLFEYKNTICHCPRSNQMS